jgi:outer membrane protein assembly factor BamB
VYFLSAFSHTVSAVDRANGTVRWQKQLTFTLPVDGVDGGFGVTTARGLVVVGDIEVIGLSPTTGATVWHFATPSVGRKPGYSRLTTDGSLVFAASVSGHIYGIDAANGTERWAAKIAAEPNVDVWYPIHDRGIVFAGYRIRPDNSNKPFTGGVAAVNANSGQLLWSRLLPQPDTTLATDVESVAVTTDYAFGGGADGNIYVFHRLTGEPRSVLPKSMFVPAGSPNRGERYRLHAIGNRVFVGAVSGHVTAIDVTSLVRVWQSSAGFGSIEDLVADDELVYATHTGGQLATFNTSDGKVRWYIEANELTPTGESGGLYAPVSAGDVVYLGGVAESYAFRRK